MFISLPWDAVQPVAPKLPDEPSVTPGPDSHLSPFLDAKSPKYNVPAIIFFSCLIGIVLLVALLVVLWKRRRELIARYGPLPKWLTRCILVVQKISFPMPASAYLCGWLRVSDAGSSPHIAFAPPPYDGGVSSSPTPPGLQPPPRAAASTGTRTRATPSPPPSYPPAPPPTPDADLPGAVTVAPTSSTTSSATSPAPAPAPSLIAPLSAAASRPPGIPSRPAQSAHARGRFTRTMGAPAPPPSGPPPAYPPPPLPEFHRLPERRSGSDAQEVCAMPWGSVGASTPHSSSVLARCRYEA